MQTLKSNEKTFIKQLLPNKEVCSQELTHKTHFEMYLA